MNLDPRTVLAQDLVGIPELAAEFEVRPDTVHKWRNRHADFPAPVVELRMGPIWDRRDVVRWYAERNGLVE